MSDVVRQTNIARRGSSAGIESEFQVSQYYIVKHEAQAKWVMQR